MLWTFLLPRTNLTQIKSLKLVLFLAYSHAASYFLSYPAFQLIWLSMQCERHIKQANRLVAQNLNRFTPVSWQNTWNSLATQRNSYKCQFTSHFRSIRFADKNCSLQRNVISQAIQILLQFYTVINVFRRLCPSKTFIWIMIWLVNCREKYIRLSIQLNLGNTFNSSDHRIGDLCQKSFVFHC